MTADEKIREVLARYEVPYQGNVWQVQGTPVIKHSALELVASRAKVRFAPPTILRAERDEAVMLVTGTLGDVTEWSVGECLVNVNYKISGKQAAYPYAMSEKRAKDRVILKLVSLHGLAYSEEEADEFKNQPAPQRQSDRHINEDAGQDDEPDLGLQFIAECEGRIAAFKDPMALRTWWASPEFHERCAHFDLTSDEVAALKAKMVARGTALTARVAA
jgi:hypothetical protein